MTDHDVNMGRGSPQTVGKFLCHLTEDPNRVAFMRTYKQIPITGTEDADNDTLARQAVPPGVCGELEAFKQLQSGCCSAVPRFLATQKVHKETMILFLGATLDTLCGKRCPGSRLQRNSSGAWMTPHAKTSVLSSVLPMSKSMQINPRQIDGIFM
jgi:hypothetical protein